MAATNASRPALRIAGNNASSAMASEASKVSGVMPVAPFKPQQPRRRHADGEFGHELKRGLRRGFNAGCALVAMAVQEKIGLDGFQRQGELAFGEPRGYEFLEHQHGRLLLQGQAKRRIFVAHHEHAGGLKTHHGMPFSSKASTAALILAACARASAIYPAS